MRVENGNRRHTSVVPGFCERRIQDFQMSPVYTIKIAQRQNAGRQVGLWRAYDNLHIAALFP